MLVGNERFSEHHAWSEMPQHWPPCLAGRAVIEVVGHGQLEARLVDGGPPVDVVVPLWSPLPGRAIRAGNFGLVQQFGVGTTPEWPAPAARPLTPSRRWASTPPPSSRPWALTLRHPDLDAIYQHKRGLKAPRRSS